MIAQADRAVQFLHEPDALAGLSAVADDVSDLNPVVDADSAHRLDDRFERFEVAATMLGAGEYAAELQGFASARYKTLAAHLGPLEFELSELSLGRLAGLAWLSELMKLQAIASGAPGQSHFLDFDAFLAEPRSSLEELCSFLSLGFDDQALDRLMESPVLSQYSKAPDHPFDAAARQARIAEAKAKVGGDIEEGLAFIAELTGGHPSLAQVTANCGYIFD